MIIHPEIIVTPDLPTIKFKQPRDQVDLDVELPKILHTQGWGCGTYFHIQFVNHEKTKLLASATFVVSEETESIHTSDNQYNPVTKTIFTRSATRIGDWWEKSKNPSENISEKISAKVKWNPGKKVHQVIEDGKIIYENADKEQALKVAEAA